MLRENAGARPLQYQLAANQTVYFGIYGPAAG